MGLSSFRPCDLGLVAAASSTILPSELRRCEEGFLCELGVFSRLVLDSRFDDAVATESRLLGFQRPLITLPQRELDWVSEPRLLSRVRDRFRSFVARLVLLPLPARPDSCDSDVCVVKWGILV